MCDNCRKNKLKKQDIFLVALTFSQTRKLQMLEAWRDSVAQLSWRVLSSVKRLRPERSTVCFWRAGGAGEDKRCWRRETDEEMFLLAAVPDAAALAVSVTSSVSSCYCSSGRTQPHCPPSLRPALPDIVARCHVCKSHLWAMIRGDRAAVVSVQTAWTGRIQMTVSVVRHRGQLRRFIVNNNPLNF